MPEINVSCLIRNVAPSDLSASIAERGANAGRETWANSLNAVKGKSLVKPADRPGIRNYFAEFGAWEREEIAHWSTAELNAMVLQYAAGDLRDLQALCPGKGPAGVNWKKAERLAKAGTVSGNLFPLADELWISLGN